jgi:predicted nucleic acid-binding protein
MTVVDASVALKWVIDEDGSEAAGALLLEEPLAAPDLLMVECANVLWTRGARLRGPGGDPDGSGRADTSGRLCRRRPGGGLRPRSDSL